MWCACAHNGKISALKNKIMSFVGKWIQQEIMLSELSQTQEDKHCVLSLIFVSQILSRYINHKCLGEQRELRRGARKEREARERQSRYLLKVVMYLSETFSETHSMYSENTATEMCIIFKKRKRVLLCRFTDQLKARETGKAGTATTQLRAFCFPTLSLFLPSMKSCCGLQPPSYTDCGCWLCLSGCGVCKLCPVTRL